MTSTYNRLDSTDFAKQLWRTTDGERWFLIPDVDLPPPGPLVIRPLTSAEAAVDSDQVRRHEVSEEEARAWARDELGKTLDQLKLGVDEKLADIRRELDETKHTPVSDETQFTPDAFPALFSLLKTLPGVIGRSLSGDAAHVETAAESMAALQRRLKEAGIDLDAGFLDFPQRLAQLREEFEKRGEDAGKEPPAENP